MSAVHIVPMCGALGRRGYVVCDHPGVWLSACVKPSQVSLLALHVEESRRSQGVGTAVLQALVKHAAGKPVRTFPAADDRRRQRVLEAWYLRNGVELVENPNRL